MSDELLNLSNELLADKELFDVEAHSLRATAEPPAKVRPTATRSRGTVAPRVAPVQLYVGRQRVRNRRSDVRPSAESERWRPRATSVRGDHRRVRASTIRGMARFLHTMVRITDPEKSRAFYEALGFRFDRDMDIVRDGQVEATNYFFSLGDTESVLELTFNHDGRAYDVGTGYGHIAIGVDDLDGTLARLAEQGIEPERPPYQVREGGSWLCFVRDPDDYRIEIIGRG
jgi:lactoylglutathione lyase